MAALLVVAIVSAMAPPRALPCGKIHPFYLSLYFGSRPLDFVAHAEAECGDINQLIDEQLARARLNACVRWRINLSR
jgi:hypothetical protein